MRVTNQVFEKKIRALCDFSLNTLIEDKTFISGEVATIKFMSRKQFNSFLEFKKFEEVDEIVPVERIIPIIEEPPIEEIPTVVEDREGFVLEDNIKNKVDDLVFREE